MKQEFELLLDKPSQPLFTEQGGLKILGNTLPWWLAVVAGTGTALAVVWLAATFWLPWGGMLALAGLYTALWLLKHARVTARVGAEQMELRFHKSGKTTVFPFADLATYSCSRMGKDGGLELVFGDGRRQRLTTSRRTGQFYRMVAAFEASLNCYRHNQHRNVVQATV